MRRSHARRARDLGFPAAQHIVAGRDSDRLARASLMRALAAKSCYRRILAVTEGVAHASAAYQHFLSADMSLPHATASIYERLTRLARETARECDAPVESITHGEVAHRPTARAEHARRHRTRG